MSLAVPVSWWLVLLLLAAATIVGYGAYAHTVVPLTARRRVLLGGLRTTALLLLVLFLLRPATTTSEPAPRGLLSVVLDNSRSMRIVDAGGTPGRRIDRAIETLTDELLPGLDDRFDVELSSFDRPLTVAELTSVEPGAARTDLAKALRDAADVEGRAVAAIVVLSDGGDTGAVDVASAVDGLPPVYPVDVGPLDPHPDQEVTALAAGAVVAGSVVDITAEVRRRGGAGPVTVRLREGGRTLEVQQLTPPGEGVPVRTTFAVPPRRETAAVYTVEIPAEPDEVVVENNRRSVLVRPPGRARRVLMIEGAPGFEHSFLKRAWVGDPGIELDAVVRKGQDADGEHTFYVQGAPARTGRLGAGFPDTRADLFAYDAVVLANIEVGFFRPAQLAMIRAFVVERGGGLLLLGSRSLQGDGIRGSEIEDLMPVGLSDRTRPVGSDGRDTAAHRLRLTDDGAVHPIMALGRTVSEREHGWEQAPTLGGSVALGPAKRRCLGTGDG